MALPPLATPEQLASLTGRPAGDQKLRAQLKQASRRFRSAVGYPVSLVENETVELNGTGSRILLLPVLAVVSVSIVEVDGVAVTAGSGYRLDKRSGMLERVGACWPSGLGRVHVTYSHGWDATVKDTEDPPGLKFVPEDIQGAVLDMAQILLNIVLGQQSRTVLGDSVAFGTAASVGTTQDWATAVANHRIRGGA